MLHLSIAILTLLAPLISGLTPLTKIKATEVELAAFAATALGAIEAIIPGKANPTIHILGASNVEDGVDWSPLCKRGASVLLIGPEAVVPRDPTRGGNECVTVLKELYSVSKHGGGAGAGAAGAGDGDGAGDGAASTSTDVVPDLVLMLNADLYTCVWRRTLVELLQSELPAVVTFYCEFEGAAITRLFNWPELEFTPRTLERCDATLTRAFGETSANLHAATAADVSIGDIPEARILWEFDPNPHAHAAPKECYSLQEHGTRNAYWMAFTGAPETKEPNNSADRKDEL